MKTIRARKLGVLVVLLASSALAQKVIQPWEVPCTEELVKPNLELKEPRRLSGELKNPTGTPFQESRVVLRKLNAKGKLSNTERVTTDKEGNFDLGTLDAGKYRFLPAPSRGFKQPQGIQCREDLDCEIKLVLQLNPSDQEFGGCPIQ